MLVLFAVQEFKAPKRPFKRMDYQEAIDYLRANDIRKDEDGSYYEFGDVSSFRLEMWM